MNRFLLIRAILESGIIKEKNMECGKTAWEEGRLKKTYIKNKETVLFSPINYEIMHT